MLNHVRVIDTIIDKKSWSCGNGILFRTGKGILSMQVLFCENSCKNMWFTDAGDIQGRWAFLGLTTLRTSHGQSFLLVALGLGRGPHLFTIPLHHHGAVVTQPHATGLKATRGLAFGLPHHLVVPFVHHKVAVILHAQTIGIPLTCGVRAPHGLPAVDDKVAILLQRESI